MEEKEFNSQISTIEMIKTQVEPLKQQLSSELNTTFVNNVSNLIKLLTERDKLFSNYLNSLKDFNFDSELTTPSELFKGIRTVSEEVDSEELNKKTDAMKSNALDIESKSKEIESLNTNILNCLKRSIKTLVELAIQENQIYDMSIDLLQDLDSIYDIGQIASATK